MELAHRVSFAIHRHDPGDQCVLHKCDNPVCVNPAHLKLGSQIDNILDASAKGRLALSAKVVNLIRNRLSVGCTEKQIVTEFGVSRATVYRIRYNKAYKLIKRPYAGR